MKFYAIVNAGETHPGDPWVRSSDYRLIYRKTYLYPSRREAERNRMPGERIAVVRTDRPAPLPPKETT